MNYFSKSAGRLAIAPLAVALFCSPFHLPTASAVEKPMIDVEEDQAKGTTIMNQALELTRTEIGSRSVDLSDGEGHHLGCGLAAGFWTISKPEETKPGGVAYILAPTRLIQGRDELIVHFSDPTGTFKDLHVRCIREGAERNIFVGPLNAENVCAVRLPDSATVSAFGEELFTSNDGFESLAREKFLSGSEVRFTGGPSALGATKSLPKALFLQTTGRDEDAFSAVGISTPAGIAGAPVYQLVGDPIIAENDGKKSLRPYKIRLAGMLDAPVIFSALASGKVQTFGNATRLISRPEIAALAQSLHAHLQADGWVFPSPTARKAPEDWRKYIPRNLPFHF